MQEFSSGKPLKDFNVVLDSSSYYPATFGAGGNRGVEDGDDANERYPTWMQVEGAGTITYVNEDGTSTTRPCSGGEIIVGTVKSVTSMGATRLILGVGDPPPPSPAAGVADLYANARTTQAIIPVDLQTGMLAAGTPLAAFADNASSNPGITLVDSKTKAVRWNNNASQTAVWYEVPMPQDLDDTADLVLHVLASKSGATVGDATTFTVTGFFQTVGALHDADSDVGGATNALVGNATAKTVAELTRTIAAADVPESPSRLSFSIKPTDGTLGTDDAIVSGMWFEYKKKVLAS